MGEMPTATQFIQQAHLLLKMQRFTDAKKALYKVLSNDPVNREAMFLLIHVCINAEEFDEADVVSASCIKNFPEYAEVFYLRAVVLNNKQNLVEATKMIDEAIRMFPYNPNYFYVKSNIYQRRGQVNKALSFIEEGLQLDPDNKYLLQQKAILLFQLHDVRAEKYLAAAMLIDPETERNFGIKAMIQLERNEFDEAESNFLEALRLEPLNPEYLTGLLTIKKKKNIFYWETFRKGFRRLEIKSVSMLLLSIFGSLGLGLLFLFVKAAFYAICWFGDVVYESAYRLSSKTMHLLIREKIIRSNIFLLMLALSVLLFVAGSQFNLKDLNHTGFLVFTLIFPFVSFFEDWKRKIIMREIIFSILLFGSTFIIFYDHRGFYFFMTDAIILYALLWTFRAFGK